MCKCPPWLLCNIILSFVFSLVLLTPGSISIFSTALQQLHYEKSMFDFVIPYRQSTFRKTQSLWYNSYPSLDSTLQHYEAIHTSLNCVTTPLQRNLDPFSLLQCYHNLDGISTTLQSNLDPFSWFDYRVESCKPDQFYATSVHSSPCHKSKW